MRVLLLSLPLLLSACSPKALSQLRAQVRNWTGGAGRVEVLQTTPDTQTNRVQANLPALSSGRIDAVGRFTLPLPSDQVMAPLLQPALLPDVSPDCTGSLRASDPAARYYLLPALSAVSQGRSQVNLTLVSQTQGDPQHNPRLLDQRVLVYASGPTQLQGERRCPSGPGSAQSEVSYALNLKQGWNYAVLHRSVFASGERRSRLESAAEDGFEGWQVLQ